MSVILLALKRMLGLPTATADQEGQLRYHRDSTETGQFYGARYVAGGTYEWTPLSVLIVDDVPTDADFPSTPPDGSLALDTVNERLYIRCNGGWMYASLT